MCSLRTIASYVNLAMVCLSNKEDVVLTLMKPITEEILSMKMQIYRNLFLFYFYHIIEMDLRIVSYVYKCWIVCTF